MSEIRMVGEIRTDYDCETTGIPAERWGEALFTIGEEEIAMEVSVEEEIIVSIMAGDGAVWKGTLDGLKKFLKADIKGK